jgi:hypothetical protein
MSETDPYPVIEERRLPAAGSGGLLRKRRRELTDLPSFAPGTALVFQAGGRFIVYDEHDHLSGAEDFVLGALTVAVVNMRPHSFFADVTLPSARHSEAFTVRCTFNAVVVEASEVVRAGALDLPTELSYHLRRHQELVAICAEYPIEQLAEVRIKIEARIQSYYEIRGYERRGLRVDLQLIEVLTPAELAERDRRLRTAEVEFTLHDKIQGLENRKRRQALADESVYASESDSFDRMRAGEHEDWEFQREMVRKERERDVLMRQHRIEDMRMQRVLEHAGGDSDGLMRLALAEGLITTVDYANLKRGDEADAVRQIYNLISTTLQGEGGDLVSMDLQLLADKLVSKLVGPEQITDGGGAAERRALILGPYSDDPDANPPDENDFHG